MKRIALLIANTNGLEGTKADVGKFSRFLQSLQGGAWEENTEIFTLPNPSKTDLLACLKTVKQYSVDYAIVMFSGHGGYRDETILEINSDEETVTVSDLLHLAHRQLSIFDCCRVMEKQPLRDSILSKSTMTFSAKDEMRLVTRKKYEARILQSISQQAILYACSVDECSYDSKNGAVYIDKLIEVANNASDAEFTTVGLAHQKAARLTTEETSAPPIILDKNYVGPQHPEAYLPKCLSSQQLVISINPSYYYSYGK